MAIAENAEAVSLLHDLEDGHGEGVARANLAESLREVGLLDDATAAARSAIAIFEDLGDDTSAAQARRILANITQDQNKRTTNLNLDNDPHH